MFFFTSFKKHPVLPFSPPLASSVSATDIDFGLRLLCPPLGLNGDGLQANEKQREISSACNPAHGFLAAVLSILFRYVKNVEYQQWVSLPYC